MTHLLSLGAINKVTDEYVYPKIANKKDEYICPECNKDLILCQGEIRVHHFRHKVDNVNHCHHYSNPTESQIHKDAKILLKNLLERKIQLSFIRNCCCCKKNEEYEIPEISETSNVQLEYRFEYNGVKTADVAYLENDEILCIFEICNTHKTCSENRPEPWFEIDAETLIKMANDNSLTSLQIPCSKCEKCEDCVEKEKIKILHEIKLKKIFISNKLKSSTTYVQKKKWNSLLELLDLTQINKKLFIDYSSVFKSDNNYYIRISHPITKQSIVYHLKRDEIRISPKSMSELEEKYGLHNTDEVMVNNIKDWLNEYPQKIKDIKKWAINHKYLKGLEFIISSPLIKINYATKAQNNIENTNDFILWLNSFDNKLYSLIDRCISFDWKIDNVINWLKSNGIFLRCFKCNCIYSYSKGSPCCTNEYCIK
jgi:hypothetical protein